MRTTQRSRISKIPNPTESSVSIEYSGQRLALLCDLKRMTRSSLAQEMGVSQGFISQLVSGATPLPESFVTRAEAGYLVPRRFFESLSVPGQHAALTFRKRPDTSVREAKRITALFAEASRFWHMASTDSGYREVDLPDPDAHEWDPELCAETLRGSEGLAEDQPILNITRFLERHGIAVITELDPTNGGSRDHSGISRPSALSTRPLIATITSMPGGAARMALAHEAGHLIFDKDRSSPIPGTRSMEENRAYRFAGALLIPERELRKHVDEKLPLRGYLPLKAQFGITVQALVRRAEMVGVISKDRARSLSIQMSSQGWRQAEPGKVANEIPTLLKQAVNQAWPHLTLTTASEQTGVDPVLIAQWIDDSSSLATGTDATIISLDARRANQRHD